jgi:hypothetical protein
LRRRGLVERPFVAATTNAGALRVSSLILAPVPAANAALRPIVSRTSEDRITAYVELLAAAAAARSDVDVKFEVLSENASTPLIASPAIARRTDSGLTVARADLSLAGLPSGAYQARAVIEASGEPIAQVVRPFFYAPR